MASAAASADPLDMRALRRLRAPEEVERLLEVAATREREVDAELAGLLAGRASLEREVDALVDQVQEVRMDGNGGGGGGREGGRRKRNVAQRA